jgi:hypothetical protein
MVTRIHKSSRAPVHIEEHTQPAARWYVVSDTDENYLCTFELDAYLVDFENESYPHALYVVLIPCAPDWPNFLYAPNGLDGVPYEVVITQALAAYRAAHPGLVPPPALQEASEIDAEGR